MREGDVICKRDLGKIIGPLSSISNKNNTKSQSCCAYIEREGVEVSHSHIDAICQNRVGFWD